MDNEKLKKLEHDRYVAEKKLTAAQHREKRLRNELKLPTRNERTHRLCTRAGMLETFLRELTLLIDDNVMELMRFIFHSEAVQKKLDMLIENRKKTMETEVAENTWRIQVRNYTPPEAVNCVLPEAPCREPMIYAKKFVPIIQRKLHFPCAGLRQLPLSGRAVRGHLAPQAVPVRQVYKIHNIPLYFF